MARCAVTGANGFIGAHVVRALRARGHEVVALVGADLDDAGLAGLDVERRPLDLLDPAGVRAALAGCQRVVHTAAAYAFWARDPAHLYRVNVDGTRHVLAAARALGVERVVVTSSAGTLQPGFGLGPRQAANEDAVLDLRRFRGHYKTSKLMAEIVALREAALGLPVVIVHPTTVLGPGDRRPTPTGSMIVHFLNGRMKVFVDLVHDVVDVRDVALGHALALERGRPGERFLLGGERMTMREIVRVLAELTGLPEPRLALPPRLLAAIGRVDEWLAARLGREPLVPVEAALHARDSRPLASERAQRLLGLAPRPGREVLADAARWFAEHGYCPRGRAQAVLARLAETAAPAEEVGPIALPLRRTA